jgi:hypothetical protein
MKTNDLIEEKKKEFEKEFGHHGEIWNGKKFARDGIEAKDFLSQSLLQIAEAAREESYQSFIDNLGYVLTESGQLRGNMQRLVNDYELILDKLKQPEKKED